MVAINHCLHQKRRRDNALETSSADAYHGGPRAPSARLESVDPDPAPGKADHGKVAHVTRGTDGQGARGRGAPVRCRALSLPLQTPGWVGVGVVDAQR